MVSDTTGSASSAETDPRISSSPVVTRVFDDILDAVIRGELGPGQRINDSELAGKFGVSRTPVREALQRLRDIGVIEASASRFTRVADVTPVQTLQAYLVWQALYALLLEEVIPTFAPEAVAPVQAAHDDFVAGLGAQSAQQMATANFVFVTLIAQQSRNPILQRSLVSVVHIVRLGSLHLPDYIDVESLGRAQALLVEACSTRDIAIARQAMEILRGIRIPLE